MLLYSTTLICDDGISQNIQYVILKQCIFSVKFFNAVNKKTEKIITIICQYLHVGPSIKKIVSVIPTSVKVVHHIRRPNPVGPDVAQCGVCRVRFGRKLVLREVVMVTEHRKDEDCWKSFIQELCYVGNEFDDEVRILKHTVGVVTCVMRVVPVKEINLCIMTCHAMTLWTRRLAKLKWFVGKIPQTVNSMAPGTFGTIL